MITARTPFQIYRADGSVESVAHFNSLPLEVALPFKIRAAEEALVASLTVVDSGPVEREKYAISTLKSACTYVGLLASFIPIMARSQTAQHIAVNYDALVRTAAMFSGGETTPIATLVRDLVVQSAPATLVAVSTLSDLEDLLADLQKSCRLKAKDAGENVEMLRKVAPEDITLTKALPSVEELPLGDDDEHSTSIAQGSADGDVVEGRQRQKRSRPSPAAGSKPAAKDVKLKVEEAGESVRKPSRKALATSVLVIGRLRAMTTAEKKAVAVLHQINELLAHTFANKFNDLIVIFDHIGERIKVVQAIIDAERAAYEAKENKKPPEPFHETSLQGLKTAVSMSTRIFREDDDCRMELNEDLLHRISHACTTVINQIEGYDTTPFQEPTEEEKQKKAAARAASKAKRDEAQRKVTERLKAKEELASKKEEERRLLRQRMGVNLSEEALVDDDDLKNPVPTAYVRYSFPIPLGNPALFGKALYIWSMLVSIPKPLLLSQMPLKTFLRGLQEENQDTNGLIEEVTRCLLDLCVESTSRVTSPTSPRFTMRGKNWFEALVEFVGVASGNRKKRQQKQQQKSPSSSDEEAEDDEDNSSDDDSDGDTSSYEEEEEEQEETSPTGPEADNGAMEEKDQEEEKVAPAPPREELTELEKEIRMTMDHIAELRSMATWGNVDMVDRLNLLTFCVHEALANEKVVTEAEVLYKNYEDEAVALEKSIRDIREEAEKELKVLLRALPVGDSKCADTIDAVGGEGNTEYTTKRERILQLVDKKRKEACTTFYSRQDELDVGAIIAPLGQDRFRRFYWRFPLDRVVYVQSTASTLDFPILPEPSELQRKNHTPMLLDEEETQSAYFESRRYHGGHAAPSKHEEPREEAASESGPAQRTWGIIPPEYIPTFIKGLDTRGEREAHLRQVLEEVAPYLQKLEEPHEGRLTRSRVHTFGYSNKLKANVF